MMIRGKQWQQPYAMLALIQRNLVVRVPGKR
jgi:hypothetical protein